MIENNVYQRTIVSINAKGESFTVDEMIERLNMIKNMTGGDAYIFVYDGNLENYEAARKMDVIQNYMVGSNSVPPIYSIKIDY